MPGTGFRSRESFFPLLASVKPELQREVKDLLRSVIFQNDPATVIPSHTHAGTDITSSGLVADGFTGTDLSATGPGVLIQASSGASFTLENPLSVARGGTGAATFSSHQILYGSGTSAIGSSSSLIFNPTQGRLSLNIAEVNTQTRLHVFGENSINSSLMLERASADVSGPYTWYLKSRAAYKSSAVVNDYTGGAVFSIYNSATTWKDVAAIWGQATNVTSGTEAGDIVFFCATDGAIADADERMRITSAGSLSLVGAAPTARLHLPAGTATASTAPLKLATGTALAAAEDGAMEYDTSHLWFTIGATRYQLDQQSSVPTTITVADESADTTCFPLFVTAATGDLGPKTNALFTFNSSTGAFGAGALSGVVSDAVTNSTSTVLTLGHNTTGTAAANFGSDTYWNLETSTTADTTAARVKVFWSVATHAGRQSKIQLSAYSADGEAPFLVALGQPGPYAAVALGSSASATGVGACAFGISALASAQEGVAVGSNSTASGGDGYSTAIGSRSTASGGSAVAVGGAYSTASGIRSLSLGQWVTASNTNSIIIGSGWTDNVALTNATANTIALGNYTATTSTILNQFALLHNSTGTPAAGFGSALDMKLESSTTIDTLAASVQWSWVTATHGSRAAQVKFYAYDTAARECIAIQASGTVAMLGFFGTAATTKPTALTTALTTVTASAPGTPDYAIADLTAGGFGFVAADEGQTVLTVIANLQARVNELETKLQSLGLLT